MSTILISYDDPVEFRRRYRYKKEIVFVLKSRLCLRIKTKN